ncbi:MAG: L,D-transpeptidase family protein [Chthoniobacterales bacterium]
MRCAAALMILSTALSALSASGQTHRTVAERVREFGPVVRQRLEAKFRAARVSYPPPQLTLVGFKKARRLEVYASDGNGGPHFICAYPVLAASGKLGPKLRQGDRQVPEGIYGLRELNPNSRFHLSLWVDYPNQFERARGEADGRKNLGGEIMIHGAAVSKGCLAMGDAAAEDLFVLAALTGIENVKVILSPVDFREESLGEWATASPTWTRQLYQRIAAELQHYPSERK